MTDNRYYNTEGRRDELERMETIDAQRAEEKAESDKNFCRGICD